MKTTCTIFANRRQRNSRGNLAEFGPALALFFAVILGLALPFLRFGVAAATVILFVDRATEAAAKAPTYGSALIGANQVLTELVGSPMGRLAGLKSGSFEPITLFIEEENCATGETKIVGPNEVLPHPINVGVNAYEYELRTTYLLDPILPPCCLRVLPAIPLIGSPVQFTARSVHAVECPDGLTVL